MSDQTELLSAIIEGLDFLNESLLKLWVREQKALNILKQNQRNWNYLTKELKKLVEDHDGLSSYVTSNLSKRIETHIKRSGKNIKYEQYI